MKYIVHRDFNARAICGDVNLTAGTECDKINGVITIDGQQICMAISENAHQYFARNDDGNGLQRGALTQRIINKLANNDELRQERWDKVWDDNLCKKYKRSEPEDHWLWSHSFYGASIEDLTYIAELIGA